jgi:hypothetical protein
MASKVIRQNVLAACRPPWFITPVALAANRSILQKKALAACGEGDLQAGDSLAPRTIGNCYLYQKPFYDLYMSSKGGVEPHYRLIGVG